MRWNRPRDACSRPTSEGYVLTGCVCVQNGRWPYGLGKFFFFVGPRRRTHAHPYGGTDTSTPTPIRRRKGTPPCVCKVGGWGCRSGKTFSPRSSAPYPPPTYGAADPSAPTHTRHLNDTPHPHPHPHRGVYGRVVGGVSGREKFFFPCAAVPYPTPPIRRCRHLGADENLASARHHPTPTGTCVQGW